MSRTELDQGAGIAGLLLGFLIGWYVAGRSRKCRR